jgi:alkylhydroperoxidase/carboxymuconolactone decarboxylase family protein YurZ
VDRTETLTDREKAGIALGAAVGAGCHICAENLYSALVSLGATADELEQLFATGLAARRSATDAMRRTASALMGRHLDADREPKSTRNLDSRIALAAAAGANCAADALHHADRARSAGATDAQIGVAVGIARSVRSKAQLFSDQEISKSSGTEPVAEAAQSCCGPTAEGCC